MYVWIHYNTWFIYQYHLKAVIQRETRVINDMGPLSSMRRNTPFPRVPGPTAELSPLTSVNSRRKLLAPGWGWWGWNCVWAISALSWREKISFPHCVQCLIAWAVLILRRWYDSSYWFWKPDNYSVTNLPLLPLKGEKRATRGKQFFFFFQITSVFNTGNSHMFFF